MYLEYQKHETQGILNSNTLFITVQELFPKFSDTHSIMLNLKPRSKRYYSHQKKKKKQ